MKHPRTRSKSDKVCKRVLRFTPTLSTAAKKVIRAYDAFGWEEVEDADLDTVFLNFDTIEGLERADDLLHTVTLGKAGRHAELSHRFNQRFEHFLLPLRNNLSRLIETFDIQSPAAARLDLPGILRRLENELQCLGNVINRFSELLKQFDLRVESPDSRMIDLWKSLNVAIESSAEVFKRAMNISIEAGKNGLALDCTCSGSLIPPQPVRFGDRGDMWVSWRLCQFGVGIVALSRRLAQIDTGAKRLTMSQNDISEVEAYQELFSECGRVGIEVSARDEVRPAKVSELERKIGDLSKALRVFLKLVCNRMEGQQNTLPQPATVTPADTNARQGLPQYVLTQGQGTWRLVFAGEQSFIKDSKGLRYVDYLLKHPNLLIYGSELASRVEYTAVIVERNLGIDDREEFDKVRKQMRELRQIIDDPNENEVAKKEAEGELEEFATFAKKLRGNDQKQIRAVWAAIQRLLDKLAEARDDEVLRSFGEHLDRHLRKSLGRARTRRHSRNLGDLPAGHIIYEPPPGVNWSD